MPLTDQDLSWIFGPQPVPEQFDKEAFSHPPPRPLKYGGDEGDAVQRQVDRLRDLPGTVEEIFPNGPAWAEHKLFWTRHPSSDADKAAETPSGPHDVVTYLHHTEWIWTEQRSDRDGRDFLANYGRLYAQYDLREMYDLSGRLMSGGQRFQGRLMLDPESQSHILGREIDRMPLCIRNRLLARGAELQARHDGQGWWRARGGCYSSADIDTDPAYEVLENQHPPGSTLTETWVFDPSIDPHEVNKSRLGVSDGLNAVRTYQQWKMDTDSFSKIALITSYLPGTDLCGPPTKVCVQFDGCTVQVPPPRTEGASRSGFNLRPELFVCDLQNPKRRDHIAPWKRGRTGGALPAHESQLRAVAVNEGNTELPAGLRKELDAISSEYALYYGSSKVLSPSHAAWQLTTNANMTDDEKRPLERSLPGSFRRVRELGVFASEYPTVSWEYRYRPMEQDEFLQTRAHIDYHNITGNKERFRYGEDESYLELTGIRPRGSDGTASPDMIRVRHRGRLRQPSSQKSGIEHSFEPFYASCYRAEVMDADSGFPVWYADECNILPDRASPQKSLIQELISDSRTEAADQLTQWTEQLRAQRGGGQWTFMLGAFDVHGCCQAEWSPDAGEYTGVRFTGWWAFTSADKRARTDESGRNKDDRSLTVTLRPSGRRSESEAVMENVVDAVQGNFSVAGTDA